MWLSLETLLTWWLVYGLALVTVCGAVHPNFIVIVIGGGGGGSGGQVMKQWLSWVKNK